MERITVIANNKGSEFVRESDVAATILARDWKGLQNWGGNCVIEINDDAKAIRIGNLYGEEMGTGYAGNVWDVSGLSPTLMTMKGGNRQPLIIDDFYPNRTPRVYSEYSPTLRSERIGLKVFFNENQQEELIREVDGELHVRENTKQGYAVAVGGDSIDIERVGSKNRRGRVGKQISQTLMAASNMAVVEEYNLSDKGVKYVCDPKRGMCTDINAEISQTVTAKGQSNWTGSFISPDIEKLEKSTTIGSKEPTKIHLKNGETITSDDNLTGLRVRRLTPRECWRLMDCTDEDFDKAASVISNSRLYACAGNAIIVNVLVAIMGQLFEGKEEVYRERG